MQDDRPRRKGARQTSGVVVFGPSVCNPGDPGDPGDVAGHEGSEVGSDADSHSEHSGDDVDVDQGQIDVHVGAGGVADQERHDRKRPFGPWTLSEIWSKQVHVGWGRNCGQHFGDGLQCKKNVTALASALDRQDAFDQAERICKQWLLMGRSIRPHDRCGRRKHVLDIARQDIALGPHAELDAEAAALL